MRALLLLLTTALVPASVVAETVILDPCSRGGGVGTGPVEIALLDGGLGAPRRACPRTDVGAKLAGRAIIETEDFYGDIVGALQLDGSMKLDDQTELFARLELVRADLVISSLSATRIGIGFLTAGGTRQLMHSGLAVVALTGRLRLPTAIGLYKRAVPMGLDAGVTGAYQLGPSLEVHGGLSLVTTFVFSSAPAAARFGANLTAGMALYATRWLAFVLDLGAGFAYGAALDHVTAAIGIRAGGSALGFELGLRVPLLGADRTLAAFGLGFTWRF